jgi:hypothetical protein
MIPVLVKFVLVFNHLFLYNVYTRRSTDFVVENMADITTVMLR